MLPPPNIVLPVLFAPPPNMFVPVFAFEPKPEAEGKLDTVRRGGRGDVAEHIGAVARKGIQKFTQECVHTSRCVVVR